MTRTMVVMMMIINDHGDGYGGDDKDHYSDGIGWRTKLMVDTCGHGAGDVCQEYMRDHVMPVLMMILPARRCPT